MREQDWIFLQEDAPVATKAFFIYFQERYMASWQQRILITRYIHAYLWLKGIEIKVTGLHHHWRYVILSNDQVVASEQQIESEEVAQRQAIMNAFTLLEKVFST